MSDERRLSGLSLYAPDGVRDQWDIRTQRLEVTHVTTYRYENPVQRSSHLLRLRPETGLLQSLEDYDLSISVDASKRDFEDVFGNRTTLLDAIAPFQEMRIESRSVVTVGGRGQDDPYLEHDRPTLPLVWMPWEH